MPRTGFHHSQKSIEKMRLAHLEHSVSDKTRDKLRQANLNKTVSLKTRKKISENHKRSGHLPPSRKGIHHSQEAIEKIRQANLKRQAPSPAICKKISNALKGHLVSAATKEKIRQSELGKYIPPETCKKMCDARKGDKNPNWQGGISNLPYPMTWTEDLKEAIRKRDQHTCQLCGRPQAELKKKLDIHHIDYDKKNLNTENLVSLCGSCHMKTNYNREVWVIFFKQNS